MTLTAQATGFDSACPTHEQEARLLVELLRTSRLSLLYAESGTDKTAFLTSELIPLLYRHADDLGTPAAVRPSGVVVPFPDRGSHSDRSSNRRREVVVHCDGWSDTPLATLRESLHMAVAAAPADTAQPSARLSEVFEGLAEQFDVRFIVLLDRFEVLFQGPQNQIALDQFLDELAEAINHASLSANFLIALAEEERPRLARLRTRIPGFDNFSLKLAPRRDIVEEVAPLRLQEPAASAMVLPLLTERIIVSDGGMTPRSTASKRRPELPARPKVKRVPIPPVQVKTEDVYAMIAAALARIATAAQACDARLASTQQATPALLPRSALSESQTPASLPPTRWKTLTEAIEKMERRLGTGLKVDSR